MSTSDLIMSILAEKPLNLMSWNVTCGAGGTLAGRKAFILKVSGFKHQGAVVIFPNSLDGYFDIELIDESGEVVESVEYISACKLSEIIDQLVEVTENYSDDIVRWLRKCTPNENQIQKIGRMAKVCPEVAAEIKLKTLFSKRYCRGPVRRLSFFARNFIPCPAGGALVAPKTNDLQRPASRSFLHVAAEHPSRCEGERYFLSGSDRAVVSHSG